MFGPAQKKAAAQRVKGTTLHSIAGVQRGRAFEGSFKIGGVEYDFSYQPDRAALSGIQLELTGSLTVIDGRKNARVPPHNVRGVRATLIAAQGGIGTPPPRDKQPPDIYTASANLPAVESSGASSFCGALYFKLEPLKGGTLGLPTEMSNVQLNARLAPRNDEERRLQSAYSSIVDHLYGKEPNSGAASDALVEINKLLAVG